MPANPFAAARQSLATPAGSRTVFNIDALGPAVRNLPYSIKVLLESCVRNYDGYVYTEAAVRDFVTERRWDWDIVLDPGERTALAFGTTGQPETFAIAPDGLVVGRRVGEASVEDFERLLAMARGQA